MANDLIAVLERINDDLNKIKKTIKNENFVSTFVQFVPTRFYEHLKNLYFGDFVMTNFVDFDLALVNNWNHVFLFYSCLNKDKFIFVTAYCIR